MFALALLLIFASCIGVAVQSISAVIALIFVAWRIFQNRKNAISTLQNLLNIFWVPIGALIVMLLGVTCGGFLNPKQLDHSLLFWGGYSFLVFGPFFLGGMEQLFKGRRAQWALQLMSVVQMFLAVVSISQMVQGWKVEGTSIVEAEARARGFYSHPMTLAYVSLIWTPVAVRWLNADRRNPFAWASFIAVMAIVVASQSRVVQVLVVIYLGWMAYATMPRKNFLVCGLVALLSLATFLATDSPMARKYKDTFSGAGHGRQGPYWDDRLAFWDAASLMVKERPILGHGDNVNRDYRESYYVQLGLPNFPKMYEAHNQYLQLMVNGGLVALLGFLVWFAWNLREAWRLRRQSPAAAGLVDVFFMFAVAGLTQNAIQSSVVRFSLALVVTAFWGVLVSSKTRTV